MKKLTFSLLLVFTTFIGFSQNKSNYNIGILLDHSSEELQPLIIQLMTEIKAVVGEDAVVTFPEQSLLINNFNIEKAAQNYQTLLNDDTDIILAFGTVNNLIITRQESYKKPTILFGVVNKDVVNIDESVGASGINNLTYIITSQSYIKDLQTFKKLYDFKNIGIFIEDFIPDLIPIKETLDKQMEEMDTSYRLISYANVMDIKNGLEGIDAVYLAGGFYLNNDEIKELSKLFIEKGLPSFTSTDIEDVTNGILATNQADESLNRFFRRIALNVESIINGVNPSELPIYIAYNDRLTVNYNTAELVGVPIKYSLISTIDFVGEFKNVLSKRKYTLLDVMNQTIEDNLSLQSERKNVTLSQQDVKIAKSSYYPNVTATASGLYTDPKLAEISSGIFPEYETSGNIALNQTLFSETANANITIQKQLEKAQQETYNTVELDAILNSSIAYFNTLILKTNVQVQAQNLNVTKRNLEIATQNYEAGQSGKTDVLRLRSEQAQNTQTFVEAANQLEQAFHALNQILNNEIDYEIDVEDAELENDIFEGYSYKRLGRLIDNPKLRKPIIEFLIEEAKKNAPEIKYLDYNLKATERSLKLNSSGRFVPTLGLQGQYNRQFNQWGTGSNSSPILDDNYSIGLNLSIPIFQQNQQNINKQTAGIQKDQLNINRENTLLSIERNVNDAILGMINEIANIELSQVSEETAKESLELTQVAYSSGAVTITELLDAQRNYLQAQLSKANANYNYLLSSMQLERYIGRYFLLQSEEDNQNFMELFNEFRLNRN